MVKLRTASAIAALTMGLFGTLSLRAQYSRYPVLSGNVEQLKANAVPSWLIFDVSLRTRGEGQQNIDLTGEGSAGYNLVRGRVGIRVEPTSWLGIYAQAQDAHAPGLSAQLTNNTMRDTFDLRQAAVTLHGSAFHLRAGRQPIRIANERLVGVSDWTNVGRSFDAILFDYDGAVGVTAFTSSVVNVYPGRFDRSDGGLHFHGVVVDVDRLIPGNTIEPFLYVKDFASTPTGLPTDGNFVETTFGTYAKGEVASRLSYEATLALQKGSYGAQSIAAAATILRLTYQWKTTRFQPKLSYEYDYASGNSDTETHRTFDQLYPSNHDAFGLTDLFGWQNIRQNRLGLAMAPRKNLTLTLESETLRLPSRADSIYGGGGTPLVVSPKGGFTSNVIGSGIDFSGKYIIGSLVANFGIGHLFAGSAVQSSAGGPSQTLGYASLTYRFKISNPTHRSLGARSVQPAEENESDDR